MVASQRWRKQGSGAAKAEDGDVSSGSGDRRSREDAALELASGGHHVHIFTAHHDPSRCFDETKDGKLTVCVYGDFLPRHLFYRLRRLYRMPIDWLEERTTGMADSVLVNSEFTASTFAETFRTLHLKGIRPTVLYLALDINQFPVRSRLQSAEQDHMFLSINRFERKKNVDLAISAFALLLAQNQISGYTNGKQLRLVVAGGHDERLRENREYLLELMQLAAEKGVSDHVAFLPSCSTATRDELLVSCVCLLFTPMHEHFGIVPLEAMAAQKPVIACNSGGPQETVVHNVTGFLCEPTPKNFSSAMYVFLCKPEMAVKMGISARQHAEDNFSRHVFGDRLNEIAANLLNQA